MKRLRHPHILPPLTIEVPDVRVPSHVAAGWLLVEEPSDPEPTGEDHDPERTPHE